MDDYFIGLTGGFREPGTIELDPADEIATPAFDFPFESFSYYLSGPEIDVRLQGIGRPEESERGASFVGTIGFALVGPPIPGPPPHRLHGKKTDENRIGRTGIYKIGNSALRLPVTCNLPPESRGSWIHYVLAHESSTLEVVCTELTRKFAPFTESHAAAAGE